MEDVGWVQHEKLLADVLAVRQIVLVDNNGRTRLELSVSEDGLPAITLRDAEGRDRLYAMLDETGTPCIVLRGEEHDAADIGLSKEGESHIRLYDTHGTMRSAVYLKDDRPAVKLYDTNDTVRFAAFLEQNGPASVEFCDKNGGVQAKLTVAPNGEEGLIIEQE